MAQKSILITGAGGFIGGFLVQEALDRGYDTWAAVRKSTNLEYLQDPRIHFIEFDFTNPDSIEETLQDHLGEYGKWDYIIHNLGATKCANYADFEKINYGYMRTFVDALRTTEMTPECFLLMSSLSVMGPGAKGSYKPFDNNDIPQPNTYYGTSKLKAETYLQTLPDFPYTIFRCTGVYGPHERDYYLMIKTIKYGFDFSVGFSPQMLTFVYVKDLARAAMLALEKGPMQRPYFISHPQKYTQKEFRTLVCKELGKRFAIPVICPLWMLKGICAASEWVAKVRLKTSTLNRDKYHILSQRNWLCDTTAASRDLGFDAEYDLQQGLHETIEWYRQAGWL